MQIKYRQELDQDWIAIFLFGVSLAYVICHLYSPTFLRTAIQSIFSDRAKKTMYRDVYPRQGVMWVTNVLYAVTLSFFLWEIAAKTKFIPPGKTGLAFTGIAVVSYIALKTGLKYILAYLFGIKWYHGFARNWHSGRAGLGILLLLSDFLLIYTVGDNLQLTVVISIAIGLAIILPFLRTYLNYRNQLFKHWFFFILYLCALEIAPYLLVYKLFIDN